MVSGTHTVTTFARSTGIKPHPFRVQPLARRLTNTHTVVSSSSTQSAAFDQYSMVPSIIRAWAAVPDTVISASALCTNRQCRGANLRRTVTRPAAIKMLHIASTPHIENGVAETNNSASITSGGLVIHRPATCKTTASTSVMPTSRWIRRARNFDPTGTRPAASSGWNNISANAVTPAKPAAM